MLYGFCSRFPYAFEQCKNFENRLTFDKVTECLKVGTLLRHSVESLVLGVAALQDERLGKEEKKCLV